MLLKLAFQSLFLLAIFGLINCNHGRNRRSSELMYGHYGPGSHCEVNGELIAHSHTFTSSCLQHQCIFGTSFIISEACEDNDRQCHPVGEEWIENCVTYICTKTTREGFNYFQSIVKQAKCRDVKGICHEPGEVFSYRLHGILQHNCSCSIADNRKIYRCA